MTRIGILIVTLVVLPFAVASEALAQAGAGESATAAVEVTVWRRISDPSLLYISTRPQGGDWRTLNTPLDMSMRSRSGLFHQSNAVGVEVPLGDGATAAVEVTVWRRISNPSLLYVSTRPEGGDWVTLNTPLDMSMRSRSGLFHQSNAVRVEVPLPEPLPEVSPDRGTLTAFYDATDGPNWTDNTNWLTEAPLGEWYGVATDDDGRVTGLELHRNELRGEIPPELSDLAHLKRLWLHRNQLSGEIPPELATLPNLTSLRLQANQLSGEIPSELGNLSNLTDLRLVNNQLSGEIPAALGNLANLTDLRLGGNRLSGEIPPELGNLSNLTSLSLHENQFSGEIPPWLASLSNLTSLSLSGNQLSGEIPPWLASLSNLTSLSLSGNQLSGKIPPWLGDLVNLTSLSLDQNLLSGEIPPELGNLSNLTWLSLRRNQLSGEIPPELGDLPNLKWLRFDTNQLSGEIPSELSSLASLTTLSLISNRLSGEIPPELATLANLTKLALSSNELSGEIPPELATLANLTELALGGNELSGEIPRELGNLTNLTVLALDWNQLSGEIPPELGNLANLTSLQLGGNRLSGEISPTLATLAHLERLWLHRNQLSGEIPPGLAISSTLTDLRLDGNQLSGVIPDSPVPTRLTTGVASPRPSGQPPVVALEEVFAGRKFERPVEIGTYPVRPTSSAGAGLFVAELEGRILLLHPDEPEAIELLDISERVSTLGNEEGLLSVALDPRFEETGHLWLYYSVLGVPRVTRLSRFTVDLEDLRRVYAGSELAVLEVNQPFASHNGGSIRFGPDGMLYLSLGDGGSSADAMGHGQNLGTLLGSVIRIDVRDASAASPYVVPQDNPYVDVQGARPEIWAYGFRNPWRMAFDPVTGALWLGDVGRHTNEEINRIEVGGNYGWNRFEGTHCSNPRTGCEPEGTTLPEAEYGHHLGCSVTGGVVYRGEAIPELVGHYLFSDFCRGQLWALPLDGGDVVQIATSPRSVTSFGTDADGEVYALTFWGAVLRILAP